MSDQSCPAIDEIHHRSLMNRVKGHVTNESRVTQKAFKSNRQQPKVGKFEWPNLWMKHSLSTSVMRAIRYCECAWRRQCAHTCVVHQVAPQWPSVIYAKHNKASRSELANKKSHYSLHTESCSLTFFFFAKFHAAVSPKAKPTSFSIVCVPATSINRAIKSIE